MIICAGTVLIDCIITASGTESVADAITLAPGGEAFNEAVSLARLGERVRLIAPVGHDAAGGMIRTMLNREGIELQSVYDGATLVSLLTVDTDGGRRSRVSKAHSLAGYHPNLPGDGFSFVTMASLFRPPFLDPADCLDFACRVKSFPGTMLLADTKLPKGTDPQLADYRKTLALLDWITPNEAEALHYTQTGTPEEAARVFRSYGVRNVVIKLAERGCFVLPESGKAFTVPAFPVECVDGIGAGDAFNAGLIHKLSSGTVLTDEKLREAVLFASACAAVSVTKRGATAALLSAAQPDALLRQFPHTAG